MKGNNSPRLLAGPVISALVLCLLFSGTALAQSMSLLTPSIANVNGALTARFGVEVESLPMVKGELEDGQVLKLKCQADLYETMHYWLDSHISSATFESELRFDPLKKEFTMSLPGRETLLRDSSLPTLLKNGWSSIETVLGPWNLLVRDEEYSLRIQTSIREADAPEGITRYVYFWSWDTSPTATFMLNFTY